MFFYYNLQGLGIVVATLYPICQIRTRPLQVERVHFIHYSIAFGGDIVGHSNVAVCNAPSNTL